MYVHVPHNSVWSHLPYSQLLNFMWLRNLCILAKKGNLWILFMRGSTWGVAILLLSDIIMRILFVRFQFYSHNHINTCIMLALITSYTVFRLWIHWAFIECRGAYRLILSENFGNTGCLDKCSFEKAHSKKQLCRLPTFPVLCFLLFIQVFFFMQSLAGTLKQHAFHTKGGYWHAS